MNGKRSETWPSWPSPDLIRGLTRPSPSFRSFRSPRRNRDASRLDGRVKPGHDDRLRSGIASMKFTLSWLKDHLETTASLAEIVEALTRVGLEVEGVEDASAKYKGFVVARVIEAKQHPNADRLRVCMVDAGDGPVQVVCGAPNAVTGMKSVFSPVGTYIPGKKITLAKGVIRGVEFERHAVLGRRARTLQRSRRHHRAARRRAGRRRLRDLCRARRSGDRRLADPQPARRDRRLRHRPRSRRRRPRQVEDERPPPGRRRASIARPRSSSTSRPKTRVYARPSPCAWCAASTTARRRSGCKGGCAPSA